MLRLCGFCGFFERDDERPDCGMCLAGHRAAYDNTTFSLNTCDHFEHKRNFIPGKVTTLPLREKEVPYEPEEECKVRWLEVFQSPNGDENE